MQRGCGRALRPLGGREPPAERSGRPDAGKGRGPTLWEGAGRPAGAAAERSGRRRMTLGGPEAGPGAAGTAERTNRPHTETRELQPAKPKKIAGRRRGAAGDTDDAGKRAHQRRMPHAGPPNAAAESGGDRPTRGARLAPETGDVG